MDELNQHPEASKLVRADRISTANTHTKPEPEQVCVVEETPLLIDVESVETFTLLCTPSDKEALAAGFLLTEGLVDGMADITVIKQCDDDPNTIRVRLKGTVPRLDDAGRNLMIVSSCGACGSENLQKRIDSLPRAGDTLKVEAALLHKVYTELRKQQSLFEACGGTHAAAVFNERGEIVTLAEDTGRHNALDKAIGKCLLTGHNPKGLAAALTSRLSMEMVGKCARAGIELITAVSAPTSMAIDIAQSRNITLCAFVRETRATVFTHPARIV